MTCRTINHTTLGINLCKVFQIHEQTYSFALVKYNVSHICPVKYFTTLINQTFSQRLCNSTNTTNRVINSSKMPVT